MAHNNSNQINIRNECKVRSLNKQYNLHQFIFPQKLALQDLLLGSFRCEKPKNTSSQFKRGYNMKISPLTSSKDIIHNFDEKHQNSDNFCIADLFSVQSSLPLCLLDSNQNLKKEFTKISKVKKEDKVKKRISLPRIAKKTTSYFPSIRRNRIVNIASWDYPSIKISSIKQVWECGEWKST